MLKKIKNHLPSVLILKSKIADGDWGVNKKVWGRWQYLEMKRSKNTFFENRKTQ